MQHLNSKNYSQVSVKLRSHEHPLTLNADNGTKLMEYLTSGGDVAPFVKLTNTDGRVIVVKYTEIVSIEPEYESDKIDVSKLEVPA